MCQPTLVLNQTMFAFFKSRRFSLIIAGIWLVISLALFVASAFGYVNAGVSYKYEIEPHIGSAMSEETVVRMQWIGEQQRTSAYLAGFFALNTFLIAGVLIKSYRKDTDQQEQ